MDAAGIARDRALGFLYDREQGDERNVRRGSLDDSALTVPDWINDVHELFPRRVVERLESDALERYGLLEIVTDAKVLQRATPNMTLLKAVLSHQAPDERRGPGGGAPDHPGRRRGAAGSGPRGTSARPSPARGPAPGARGTGSRPTSTRRPPSGATSANFDPASGRLIIREPLFFSRVRRHIDRWQVIVLVDESGSMADSVIHAAVTAAIFTSASNAAANPPRLFDTNVVDLTDTPPTRSRR